MSAAFAKNQPIVVIDEATGRRQLIYAELDANASTPQTTNLMIVPGKELTEGHTYVVALRDLRNASGTILARRRGSRSSATDKRLPPTSARSGRATRRSSRR